MIWALRQIFTPVRYLAIEQGDGVFRSKRVYDFVLPTFFSVIITGLVLIFRVPVGFLAESGLVSELISLLNLLVAFFIAALAAVATFNREGLDNEMKGRAALLTMRDSSNEERQYPLTHRQFVCYLFGYLSFISLSILIVIYFLRLFGPQVVESLYGNVYYFIILKIIGIFILFFFIWQIIFTMFLGIYFLCDRLQFMNDPKV